MQLRLGICCKIWNRYWIKACISKTEISKWRGIMNKDTVLAFLLKQKIMPQDLTDHATHTEDGLERRFRFSCWNTAESGHRQRMNSKKLYLGISKNSLNPGFQRKITELEVQSVCNCLGSKNWCTRVLCCQNQLTYIISALIPTVLCVRCECLFEDSTMVKMSQLTAWIYGYPCMVFWQGELALSCADAIKYSDICGTSELFIMYL